MKLAIYPGSFDPITLGHIDIIKRASKLFDNLDIAVLRNNSKKQLFSIPERVEMIKQEVKDIPNAQVSHFDGMLVDYAKKMNANIIVRGLHAVTDYEYEIQLAHTNKALNDDIETIFLTTNVKYSYLSSSIVKEIAIFNGTIDNFVSKNVEEKIREKFLELNNLNQYKE